MHFVYVYMYIYIFDLAIRDLCYSPADPHSPFASTRIIEIFLNNHLSFLISTTFEINAKLEYVRTGFWKRMFFMINLIESIKRFG